MKLDSIDFQNIYVDEVTIMRYNEKINKPKINQLITELISTQNRENLDGLIVYSLIYAQEMDYNYDELISQNDEAYIISSKYIDNLLSELFLERLSQDNTKYIINDNYIYITKEDCQRITDTTKLEFNNLYYNSEYNIYKVILHGVHDESIISNIEIIYKKNEYGYTILKYEENFDE